MIRSIFILLLLSLARVCASGQSCPTVTVSGPTDIPAVGAYYTVSATVAGADPTKPVTYAWQVEGGKIVDGQGTATIRVAPDDRGGIQVTSTVGVSGGGFLDACPKTASCAFSVSSCLPLPRKLDEFSRLSQDEEIARLRAFNEELSKAPDAQALVFLYGTPGGDDAEIVSASKAIKDFLTGKAKMADGRLVMINGGRRRTFGVELWIVPGGASPPHPTPDLAPVLLAVPDRN